LRVEAVRGEQVVEEVFGRYGMGGRVQATLLWAWDTSGLGPGDYDLAFSIPSEEVTWTETVTLLPRNQVPNPEPQAAWATVESDCCLVHYITGTAVERDLPALLEMLDEQAQKASQSLQISLSEPIEVTFLPRVLGHGGFASQEISVSYLDRNYVGFDLGTVVHHEMVHLLDGRLGGEFRPSFLIEGVAVYLSGGHFKPEPLMPRLAALLPGELDCQEAGRSSARLAKQVLACDTDRYIPLDQLVDDFYESQHEIGYLEAGALVEFMVKSWGWEAFSAFYRDIHPQPEPPQGRFSTTGPQYRAMDVALQAHFGLSLKALEARFLQALRQEVVSPELAQDVRLTVQFYDTVRHYQQLLDPSAYFLTAWNPDPARMRERGIVADYLRRPSQPENLALEALLAEAGESLRDGDLAGAEEKVAAVEAVLDEVALNTPRPFAADTLAAEYLALVLAAQASGYQPQRIHIEGEMARVWASTTGPELSEMNYIYRQGEWILDQEAGFSLPWRLSSWLAAATGS
jgi:hypothetical protein